MSNRDEPGSFLPRCKAERDVNGLSEYGIPSDVKIYSANPDGTKGKLLRVEPATVFSPNFNRSTFKRGDLNG